MINQDRLVSNFLKPGSVPARIVDMFLDLKFRAVVSSPVLDEYVMVLNRKEFGFEQEKIKYLLSLIGASAFELDLFDRAFDGIPEDDAVFLVTAIEGGADYMITGNTRHFPAGKYGKCKIVIPAEFLKLVP